MIQAVRRNYDGTPRNGMSRRSSFATIDRLFLDNKTSSSFYILGKVFKTSSGNFTFRITYPI